LHVLGGCGYLGADAFDEVFDVALDGFVSLALAHTGLGKAKAVPHLEAIGFDTTISCGAAGSIPLENSEFRGSGGMLLEWVDFITNAETVAALKSMAEKAK